MPWTPIDALHRIILDRLLDEYGITGLSESEKDHFNRSWHRPDPWPDSVAGLTRLKKKYTIATLSNGNMALLTNMAKHAKLPWDCILSAELAKRYKPDPELYLKAADLLGVRPRQVMMWRHTPGDLKAAAGIGMQTAFVHRPLEHGPRPGNSEQVDTSGLILPQVILSTWRGSSERNSCCHCRESLRFVKQSRVVQGLGC